ncbi:helitron_like_N domain-containing protein [Trichonephila clavipes]|nr:helitron_like_N domain-containing protein [Trichonephila clavipes]
MYSVEWQKRGLPHAHILVWFIDKIRPEEIDSIISAEIPDPSTDQLLFDIVTTNMIHGSDMAVFRVENTNVNAPPVNKNDEITLYQIGRYISSNEAAWRIFGFPIHERDPAVVQLAIHLENGQRVFSRTRQRLIVQ